jgi:DNA-binding MarR family transcriptional regulator
MATMQTTRKLKSGRKPGSHGPGRHGPGSHAPAGAKLPSGAKHVIDFKCYIPTVLSSLVAKLRTNANAFFSESYGVSLTEWRILSFLQEAGPSSAYDIWTTANLDKAVVSRETKSLSQKGLVRIAKEPGSARKRTVISPTPAGYQLLERSLQEVLARHDRLTAGLSKSSIETVLQVAAHLEARIPHMSKSLDLPSSGYVPVKPASNK